MRHNTARKPELEHELMRDPRLGFEPAGGSSVRCLQHGVPWPFDCWHYHDEYELQCINRSSGDAFVGDHIGRFEPGYVALVGARLPHTWISHDVPPEGIAERSMVIHFRDEPLRKGADLFPELEAVLPMLDRAKLGIEFFGIGDLVRDRFQRVQQQEGMARLSAFIGLLHELARWPDWRQISSTADPAGEDPSANTRMRRVLDYLDRHLTEELSLPAVCAVANMAESSFSRWFHRHMGATFTDFVTRLRVAKACEMLQVSDRLVSDICYEVGFANLANFNRRFLQLKSMTPSAYRQQAQDRFGLRTARNTPLATTD
ncbi:helix-turn-helix domain-containing protein [Variovorax atrisoli]|uniref:helix-turn-helix domain-containing protein n=1 Tax=Variovorax atrisoli TaxID=3394203 RepID=UPI001622DBE2|nr:AraC family transcriptional regulator [Variovorax sp. BK613]MBB3639233.1 AraC-like DNA-binding protein [Variovorax sp. BK613]